MKKATKQVKTTATQLQAVKEIAALKSTAKKHGINISDATLMRAIERAVS